MTVSRWKVMAGVLGVSLGGLAAIAGQTKPGDAHRTRRADEPPKATGDLPKLPPAGSGPLVPMPPSPSVAIAEPPVLAPPSGPAPSLPGPAVPAVKVGVLPDLPSPAEPKVTPPAPPKADVIPAGLAVPQTPPNPAAGPAPMIPDPVKPMPTGGVAGVSPSPAPQVPSAPPASVDPFTPGQPAHRPEPVLEPTPARPVAAAPAPAANPAVGKPMFRIILRVGEGEPMFEVRQGDDLMMKVVCEKVDVKSPEKGTGPSSVTATGKVRFAGFGAEGTCDQLSFMAGTGEVTMNGAVKIQVKDKLGRVESELTSDKMHYRLDAGALPAAMKP